MPNSPDINRTAKNLLHKYLGRYPDQLHGTNVNRGRMFAMAFTMDNGGQIVECTFSGGSLYYNNQCLHKLTDLLNALKDRDTNPRVEVPGYNTDVLAPWNGMSRNNRARGFHDCAEAYLWLSLLLNHKTAMNRMYVVAFNQDGTIAPPCENCSKWVNNVFHYVIKGGSQYRNDSNQNPTKFHPNSH